MRAALAAVLLAVSAAPASAGFRYLPPADTAATQADEAAGAPGPAEGGDAGHGSETPAAPGADAAMDDIDPPPGPGLAVWRVHAGETLRAALARWGGHGGVEVLFLTDRRYRLDGAAGFEGGFMDAVQALFRGLSHLPHAPVAARSESGTTLVVRHRSPRPPEKGEEP